MSSSIQEKIVVIYHGDCPDGFGGAWAARKKFGDRARYVPAPNWDTPPPGLVNKDIYLIDFAYRSPEVLRKLMRDNKRVTAIDHHISAEKAVKATHDYSFSLRHSGAVLAWKYFHPEKPTPKLIAYIEDSDLWTWRLSKSRELCAFIDSRDLNFAAWDKLAREFERPDLRRQYAHEGGILLGYEKKLVDQVIRETAQRVRFEGHTACAANCPLLHSQIGNALVEKFPPLGIVWSVHKNKKRVSLRSNGTVDVAKIAMKFGGGGHKRAAGFSLKASDPLPWKKITP
ncbi:MAG: hypothetical protein UY96_C0024G0010 [Parcubacteria group bacterium GW2011_GWB1_56_8]|nr:MAG: hypothetical protein UY96_C0024G0010 [Parcubacteria group bacterium GW2011_GWB1_56_8]